MSARRRTHYVYLVGAFFDDGWRAPVKVGITASLGSRIGSLQTACPFPIRIYASLELENRELIAWLEKTLHAKLAAHRLHGEWFNLTPEVAMTMIEDELVWQFKDAGAAENEVPFYLRKIGIPKSRLGRFSLESADAPSEGAAQ